MNRQEMASPSAQGANGASGRPTIENTRAELLKFLAQQDSQGFSTREKFSREQGNGARDEPPAAGIDWVALVNEGMKSWWRDHPARAATLLAQSATETYVRRKPLAAVSLAAAVGAGIVLLRPWRLVSASALVLSLVRSSNFTGMATSALETAADSLKKKESQ
jgi:ElaB/YqjD/DUF883 family membrane-anchored ribosome-binding protein